MGTLRDALMAWNNVGYEELVNQWKFLIFNDDEPVGYIPSNFADKLNWNSDKWHKESTTRTIRLMPNTLHGEECSVRRCNQALVEFCVQNQDVKGFSEALKPWVKRHYDESPFGFHPVLTTRRDIQGLKIPSPARGIFGIVTAGVHMNAYTIASGKVDRIWVAKRSQTTTYPGFLDQVVAGGMDPEDDGDPIKTLKHEAEEEAVWRIGKGDSFFQTDLSTFQSRVLIGDVQDAGRIYFCTRKDSTAGAREANHIEPGVRFCFDLEIQEGVEPVPNESNRSIAKFFALSVDEVIASLERRQWKPNSGLVMLDFLHRNGLVDDRRCGGFRSLAKMPPLPLPHFAHSEPYHYDN